MKELVNNLCSVIYNMVLYKYKFNQNNYVESQ